VEKVGIKFKDSGKISYILADEYKLKKGNKILVKTDKGIFLATVCVPNVEIEKKDENVEEWSILRIATDKDLKQYDKIVEESEKALKKSRSLVLKHKLDMRIIDASYTFDKSQLTFTFTADSRIDFRDLVKDLASIYKTRIELFQVGVRDKAKEVGGCGQCGRELCCSKFLSDFDSVSINMAKNQNIALNPNKINGVCGRLLCCLKYENDYYVECKKNLPCIGKKINTDYGEGRVISVDILGRKYQVDVEDYGIVDCELKKYESNK